MSTSRIPVSNTLSFLGLENGIWGEALLPGVYPFETVATTFPDSLRVMPDNTGPGSSDGDPRALGGFGTASIRIVPSREDLFSQATLIGGSSYTMGSAKWGMIAAVGLVVAGVWFLWKK